MSSLARHRRRSLTAVLVATALLWPQEALLSGSSRAEIVHEHFHLCLETPSITFLQPEDEQDYRWDAARAQSDLAWLGDRIELALARRDPQAIELASYRDELPVVAGWAHPEETASLEHASPGSPLVVQLYLSPGGEAATHVPDLASVRLDLALQRPPERSALEALTSLIHQTLAATSVATGAESLAVAITGVWAVLVRSGDPSLEPSPIGSLELGVDTHLFVPVPGGEIPEGMAERTVFLRHPRGALRVSYVDGIAPEEALSVLLEHTPERFLALLVFGDGADESEYAVVASEGRLGLAPMFHVAYGINEPPIVLK